MWERQYEKKKSKSSLFAQFLVSKQDGRMFCEMCKYEGEDARLSARCQHISDILLQRETDNIGELFRIITFCEKKLESKYEFIL